MAVDTRAKRESAMHFLVPHIHGAYADTSGVSDEERWAATWMYMGITVSPVTDVVREVISIGVIPFPR
jgi:hypothetical protein